MGGRSKSENERSNSDNKIVINQAHAERSVNEGLVRSAVLRAVEGEGFRIEELSVVLADHSTVRDLNRTWLGHDYETDVVSFPLDEASLAKKLVNGEVYVDLDTAAERAPEFDVSFETEAVRYVLHGLLHLMGLDDALDEDRAAMRKLENRYLNSSL